MDTQALQAPVEPDADADPACDYLFVRAAIEFVSGQWREQPSIEAIAEHVGLSPARLTDLFRRWAGLTPKAFLQALTLDHARALLRNSASVLDAAHEVGLSGPGRLHDLFVTHEAMSPGEYKTGGAGLELAYGFHATPFGQALAVMAPRGLAGLGFVDEAGRQSALDDMMRRWPGARFRQDPALTDPAVRRAFDPALWRSDQPLRIVLIGSDFEVRVWESLLRIPMGGAASYGAIAKSIGCLKAARAVGAAVGRNPVSFVVPCHRVLGASGAIGGYHWGVTRKRALLGWEAGQKLLAGDDCFLRRG